MAVGAGLYTYVVVVKKFTFAISSPDEFLLIVTLFEQINLMMMMVMMNDDI